MSDAPAASATYSRFNSRTGEFVPPRAAPMKAPRAPAEGAGEPGGEPDAARRRAARSADAGSIGCACMLALLAFAGALLVRHGSQGLGRFSGIFGVSGGGRGRDFGASGSPGGGTAGGGGGGAGGAFVGDAWEEPYHPSGRKLQDTRVSLPVTLAQLYRGNEVLNVTVQRTERCDVCHGQGGSGVGACPHCGGRGVETVNMMVGPGRYQRVQRHCPRCGGEGRVVLHRCSACGGEGFAKRRVQLPVVLSPGLQAGDTVRLPEQGDQHAQIGSGDVLVTLQERGGGGGGGSGGARAPVARRLRGSGEGGVQGERSDDLVADLTLTLREALLGFSRTVLHPGDGREVTVAAAGPPELPAAPGAELVVRGAGMPRRPAAARARQRSSGEDGAAVIEMQKPELARRAAELGAPRDFGDLRVRLQLRLPAQLSAAQAGAVDRHFPATPEELRARARADAVRAAGDAGGGGDGSGGDGGDGSS